MWSVYLPVVAYVIFNIYIHIHNSYIIGALAGFYRSFCCLYRQHRHTFSFSFFSLSQCMLVHGRLLFLHIYRLLISPRTSFYCIVLLTALFVSSCYWQPLPIDSPLSTPFSDTIKTFADALNASAPNVFQSLQTPGIIKLMDRCWCDFSSGNLFEPFNLSKWELLSVERLKVDLAGKITTVGNGEELEEQSGTTMEEETSVGFAAPAPAPSPFTDSNEKKSAISTLRSTFWRARSEATPDASEQQPQNASSPFPSPSGDRDRPIAYGEFDLEPYGFDLILDFRWTRDTTTHTTYT